MAVDQSKDEMTAADAAELDALADEGDGSGDAQTEPTGRPSARRVRDRSGRSKRGPGRPARAARIVGDAPAKPSAAVRDRAAEMTASKAAEYADAIRTEINPYMIELAQITVGQPLPFFIEGGELETLGQVGGARLTQPGRTVAFSDREATLLGNMVVRMQSTPAGKTAWYVVENYVLPYGLVVAGIGVIAMKVIGTYAMRQAVQQAMATAANAQAPGGIPGGLGTGEAAA